NRGSGCGLFFYSKDRGVGKEASQLRTTADARQLHRGTNHSEGQYQQRVAQTDVGQLSAETVGNPNVNRQHQEPVQAGVQHRKREFAPGTDGLHAASEAQHNAGYGSLCASCREHALQAALQHGRAVPPQINEQRDGRQNAGEKNGASGARGSLQRACRTRLMCLRLKEHQAKAGDHRGCRGVKQPFQNVEAEHVRDGKFFLMRQKQRANRFACAAQKKYGGKSSEREFVDDPEIRRPQILLEDLPTQRAKRVAAVNGDEGEQQVPEIRGANGVKQSGTAEIGEVDESGGAINDEAQDGESDQGQEELPRRCLHAIVSVTAACGSVKRGSLGSCQAPGACGTPVC